MANKQDKSVIAKAAWNEENGEAIDMSWTRRLMNESVHGVFKVVYKLFQGTGAFYTTVDKQNFERWLFITCSHVVPTCNIQDVLEFMKLFYPIIGEPTDNSLLKFKREHLLCCWTRKCDCVDATVIELSSDGAKLFLNLKITFLQIAADINVNDLVAILQMPEGRSKFAYGSINKVKKSKIIYHIATAPGSSGAPLLDQKCRAVAIHRAGDTTDADMNKSLADQANLRRMASVLSEIVNKFFIECPTLYPFHSLYEYLALHQGRSKGLIGGRQLGQYKFINQNFSAEF